MPIEKVPAELRGKDGKVYHIWLDITPKDISVDEESTPVFRIVESAELSRGSGSDVPDGEYERKYVFDGKPWVDKVRMPGGRLQGR
jgi:hypothetical protein